MTLRKQIVQEALSWRDTPYHDFSCLKGIGCDCVGLVIGIARAVGTLPHDYQPPHYSAEWHLHNNQEMLVETLKALGCAAMPWETRAPATILVMQYGRVSSHTAILVTCQPDYIVHAASDAGRVVHQRLDVKLLARVRGVYPFPGVEVTA